MLSPFPSIPPLPGELAVFDIIERIEQMLGQMEDKYGRCNLLEASKHLKTV